MWVYIWTSWELSNAYIWIPNPESIVLNKSSINLTTVWQTEQLTATLTPTPCDQSITWSTSDATVATVSTSWLVTCVTPWTATITATTVNWLTASCSVSDHQWWQPTANTVAYYPLNSTSTTYDESWNNNDLTNNWITFWTYNWVDCGYFNSNYAYKSWSIFTWNPTFTASIWAKTNSTTGSKNLWGFGTSSWAWSFALWLGGLALNIWGYGNDRNTGYSFTTDWHNAVFTYSNWSWTVYIDWTAVYNWTWSPNILNDHTGIWCNSNIGDFWRGYLSEAIFENVVRTAQEVSDYYDLTKSLYGIS